MKSTLLFFVLVSFARGDLFTLDVNGNECSFPSDALLFPGQPAVCGTSNILHLNRHNLSLNILDVNDVQLAFALSDTSASSTLPSSRTLVHNQNSSFSYTVEWPTTKTSAPAWGISVSHSPKASTALWFGSVGGICPLQVDFWRFAENARWTLDAVTCALQHQDTTLAFVQANTSHTTPYIGVGTQGTSSPSPPKVSPQDMWLGRFKIHNVAINTSDPWCDASIGAYIRFVKTSDSAMSILIPFNTGLVESKFPLSSIADEFILKVQTRDLLFRVFDERLYIMDAFNQFDVCVLAATRDETPVDSTDKAARTIIIASASAAALMIVGIIIYRYQTYRLKKKAEREATLDVSLLSTNEQGV